MARKCKTIDEIVAMTERNREKMRIESQKRRDKYGDKIKIQPAINVLLKNGYTVTDPDGKKVTRYTGKAPLD